MVADAAKPVSFNIAMSDMLVPPLLIIMGCGFGVGSAQGRGRFVKDPRHSGDEERLVVLGLSSAGACWLLCSRTVGKQFGL